MSPDWLNDETKSDEQAAPCETYSRSIGGDRAASSRKYLFDSATATIRNHDSRMTGTERRRRDVLIAVSSGCVTLAGCSEIRTTQSGYGTAYGYGYGTD